MFWVPADAVGILRNQAKQPDIGQLIDRALVAIENENPIAGEVGQAVWCCPTGTRADG